MSKKRNTRARIKQMTLRVEGFAPVARLQELLRAEPPLKLEIVAPRIGSPPGRSAEVR